ncbi:MAG: hypothetical protein ACD_11C00116G0003 [uncultured bacterium]|nr:MAG: hypothetical protein ACD_11C00116G0003 [uncultured bacterium]HBR71253.1 DNA polymerase I [Candidatus Moranbacteria bacterium]
MSGKKKLILIDGNAIIHRAYHALPPLMTKKGELVNAVYGFSSTLLSVIDEFKPDYVIASFDLAAPTFRHKEYKEYKATRAKAPDELYAQIPLIKKVVRAFNIPIYEKEGFEADDIIGTIAKQSEASDEEIENIIVTGDMDTLQLVNDKTKVYTMRRGLSDSILYDEEGVKKRYGISPEQLRDFKGLRGDPSDNIPGVKGIGEKTATTLLQSYKTLEGVYENIDAIKGAVKEKLEKDKTQAILSKKLATIEINAPVKLNLSEAVLREYDKNEIVDLFKELNFFSLIKRLPKKIGEEDNEISKGVADFKYAKVEEKNVEKILQEISLQKEFSFSIETREEKIVGISFSHKTGRAFYFPCSENLLSLVKPIFENKNIFKIGYDLKNSYKILAQNNIHLNLGELFDKGWDVMLAAYVLEPGRKIELEKLILTELGEEIELQKKSKGQLSMLGGGENEVDLIKTACQKADYCLKLKSILEEKIKEISQEQEKNNGNTNSIASVFSKIEMPLIETLAKMELFGIKLNPIIFKGIAEKISVKLKNLEKSIYELAGTQFNINSPGQLSDILFSVLKLPTNLIKKTKTKYSTASSELEKLRDQHKIIEKIEEYRELFKLKTTYLDTIPLLTDENSRIHTTFNQAITATGRLSSTEPNLQNIPIKTDLGKMLRTAFEAEEDFVLVSADYSQIDLRAIAHVSEDKKLIEAFHRGEDIHKITASEVNKVSLSQVSDKMRSAAKALNFGVIYGIGAYGFSQSAGISREEAQQFINTYMEKFSGVAAYMQATRKLVKENGYVETILGRRRYLPEINSPNFQAQSGAERMAINMPIQGLAADIVKLAMIKLEPLAEKYSGKARAILQIHDEIIFEVREEIAQEFSQQAKKIMENVLTLKVPLVVDVKIGENWGEL